MSNCSNHRKDLFGETDMKVVAEAIGDLHYETLCKLFRQLAIKINNDGVKDQNAGRIELGRYLYFTCCDLERASEKIHEAWQISKPFMNQKKK